MQMDVAVLDFAKAFNTVPHRSLPGKLEHYGLESHLLGWVNSCLIGRSQCGCGGEKSEFVSVDSVVPGAPFWGH